MVAHGVRSGMRWEGPGRGGKRGGRRLGLRLRWLSFRVWVYDIDLMGPTATGRCRHRRKVDDS